MLQKYLVQRQKMMKEEYCLLNENASNSQGRDATEEEEASNVVSRLLDSLISEILIKHTAVREKKRAVQFSREQKEMLEKAFGEEEFVKGAKMDRLRQEVGLSKEQVSKWFMHRRALARRKKKAEVDMKESSPVTTAEGMVGIEKKKRISFTAEQTQGLENAFAEERYIKGMRLASLVQNVKLSKEQISRWFMNRRALEWRKKNAKVYVQESPSAMANFQVSFTDEAAVVDNKGSKVAADNRHESLKMKPSLL